MNILSLFDGMSCGMIALKLAGVKVNRYVAYEIDKYAIQSSKYNFPEIEQMGDVFSADFTQYQGFDGLVGGSPCTKWSIAQTKDRETTAEGIGWDLFCQYVRALKEAKPKWFIYENNKSMSKAIRDSIRETFGFEEICINSMKVSAQNRQRYYWVGIRNEDGTYSKVPVDQPIDRGILLRDILDGAGRELTDGELEYMARTIADGRNHFGFNHFFGGADKAGTITASISKGVPYNVLTQPVRVGDMPNAAGRVSGGQAHRVYDARGKAVALCARPNGGGVDGPLYAAPVASHSVGNCYPSGGQNGQLFSIDGKSKTLSAGTRVTGHGVGSSNSPKVVVPVDPVRVGTYPGSSHPEWDSKQYRIYGTDGKATTLYGEGGGLGAKTGLYAHPVRGYATPVEWDATGNPTRATSGADGKVYTVYRVYDGKVYLPDKRENRRHPYRGYKIKLVDGFYIIRKLTVSECKRLQTVPEWYEFPVSNTQALRQLGNGWTCEVIVHLIRAALAEDLRRTLDDPPEWLQ